MRGQKVGGDVFFFENFSICSLEEEFPHRFVDYIPGSAEFIPLFECFDCGYESLMFCYPIYII